MFFAKNKTVAIAIAIFLMFSMSASMMLLPTTSAQAPSTTIPVFAYINVAPNPTGVNQRVEIIMWVQMIFGKRGINQYLSIRDRTPSWTSSLLRQMVQIQPLL